MAVVKLFVLDTGPLITLAAAEALDYFTYPTASVFIPDAVFYEATRKQGSLGQKDIIDWARMRADCIHIVPTAAFAQLPTLLEAGDRNARRGLGERAIFEVLDAADIAAPDHAVIIAEDAAVITAIQRNPDLRQMVGLTTVDYLHLLEEEGRINSAQATLAAAEDAGRHASRERALSEAHDETVAAVRAVLRRQGVDPL